MTWPVDSSQEPNLFVSLFALLPSPAPKENFLSELFGYILNTADGAAEAWLSKVFSAPLSVARARATTRTAATLGEADPALFPDMKIEAEMHSGQCMTVYSEHKWTSPCSSEQLRKYTELIRRPDKTEQRLVFVGLTPTQVTKARETCELKAFLWEDVHAVLATVPDPTVMLKEFLTFMDTHGLGPGKAITPDLIKAFMTSQGFLGQLKRYANKLLNGNGCDWPFLPQPYRAGVNRNVRDRWGRVAIEFPWSEGRWSPAMTIGFLYNRDNHAVEFTSPDSIDLLLRIEAKPETNPNPAAVLDVLRRLVPQLQRNDTRALTKGQRGNGNEWSLLIVQRSLARAIEGQGTEREQLDAIHRQIKEWCATLFSDGQLEAALRTIQSDSRPP